MKLQSSSRPGRTDIELGNDAVARLFADQGMGYLSIKGLRLAVKVCKAQADDEWPVELTVTDRKLKHASHKMSDEATRLCTYQALNGLDGEYPDAAEDVPVLQTMVAGINEHLESAAAQG